MGKRKTKVVDKSHAFLLDPKTNRESPILFSLKSTNCFTLGPPSKYVSMFSIIKVIHLKVKKISKSKPYMMLNRDEITNSLITPFDFKPF